MFLCTATKEHTIGARRRQPRANVDDRNVTTSSLTHHDTEPVDRADAPGARADARLSARPTAQSAAEPDGGGSRGCRPGLSCYDPDTQTAGSSRRLTHPRNGPVLGCLPSTASARPWMINDAWTAASPATATSWLLSTNRATSPEDARLR